MLIEKLNQLEQTMKTDDINEFQKSLRDLFNGVRNLAQDAIDLRDAEREENHLRVNSLKDAKLLIAQIKQASFNKEKICEMIKGHANGVQSCLINANIILRNNEIDVIDITNANPVQIAVALQQEYINTLPENLIRGIELEQAAVNAENTIDAAKRRNAIGNVFLGERVDHAPRKIYEVQDRPSRRSGDNRSFNKMDGQFIVRRHPTANLPKGFTYELCKASLNVIDKNTGELKKENVIAYYCKDLNCYFVSSTEYDRATDVGAIMTTTREQRNLVFHKNGNEVKITDKAANRDGKGSFGNVRSVLRECGYFVGERNVLTRKTVNDILQRASSAGEPVPPEIVKLMCKKRSLTDIERHAILKYAIDVKQLSPKQVTDFLDHTRVMLTSAIQKRGASTKNMAKYEQDIAFVRNEYERDIEKNVGSIGEVHIKEQKHYSMSVQDRIKDIKNDLDYANSLEHRNAVLFGEEKEIDQDALRSELRHLEGSGPLQGADDISKADQGQVIDQDKDDIER